MIPFITTEINSPWSNSDIAKYESEGSQRDSTIYNSHYNSRILLTEKNIFLCSLKLKNGKYKNFYIVAVKRNLFYFLSYIPEALCLEELKVDELIKRLYAKLSLHKAFADSFVNTVKINDNVQISDGCIIMVKVNAYVGEFLFPKYKEITNSEIRKKFSVLSNLYDRFHQERKAMVKCIETYNSKIDEQQKKIKKKLTTVAIRRTVLTIAPMILGMPPLSGLDSLFDICDLSDLADLSDIASSAMNVIDISDNLMI